MMKKILAVLLVLVLSLSLLASCGQSAEEPGHPSESVPVETQTPDQPEPEASIQPTDAEPEPEYTEVPADVPIKETSAQPGDADYYKKLYETEYCNYKLIRSLPTTYEETSWNNYWKLAGRMESMDAEALTEKNIEVIKEAGEKRAELKQIKSYADSAWFIWGDEMACTDGVELDYQYSSWDYEGFRPFLVPYLLEDQSEIKGIIIVIAGGGYDRRNNTTEGYPIAEKFNELGYNCFVLQRRVAPYADSDSWLDLQRSIRYIRYYADERGVAGTDCIIASGFSGGGCTISGAVCYAYGDLQPTIFDTDYTPDAIDAMNGDLDVACLIYGPVANPETDTCWTTDNPNLPAVFIGSGYEDVLVAPALNISLANWLQDKTYVELHLFAFATHGFGVGASGTSSYYWPEMADAFALRAAIQRASGR